MEISGVPQTEIQAILQILRTDANSGAMMPGWAPRWKAIFAYIDDLEADRDQWKQRAEKLAGQLSNQRINFEKSCRILGAQRDKAEARAEELERLSRAIIEEGVDENIIYVDHDAHAIALIDALRAALSKQEPPQDDGECTRCNGEGCSACDARELEQEP